jgi:hypothetical protein
MDTRRCCKKDRSGRQCKGNPFAFRETENGEIIYRCEKHSSLLHPVSRKHWTFINVDKEEPKRVA